MIGERHLEAMARDLIQVEGVLAVALGGSRARGTNRPDSDFDVGLYYDRQSLDAAALTELARRWTGEHIQVAAPGSWGPWVDGGAWLTVEGSAVDWILRDVDRVREQCERARRGQHSLHVQAGHPFGFWDVAYAGEAAVAVPLADPAGILARLRALVTPYPAALRKAVLNTLWQVDFLMNGAAKAAKRGDVTYVSLCAAHAATLVAHAWHAAAGQWATNEKGLVLNVATLDIDSHGFPEFVMNTIADIDGDPTTLASVVARLMNMPRPVG